jgi:putative transposase
MPRKPRLEMADGVHHVFARGNGRQTIFLDDTDRSLYLTLLARVVIWKRWRCLAYCLMDNHIHLLIETPLPNLGTGMHWLHSRFAQRFNGRHSRTGHVFENRFGSVLMGSDAQLWTVAAYIARNPVNAGLCARPTDWLWSSHRAIVDRVAIPFLDQERLLSFYDALGGDPLRRYREVVERGDLPTISALGGLGATEPLRTGASSKTPTFTLSTTTQ